MSTSWEANSIGNRGMIPRKGILESLGWEVFPGNCLEDRAAESKGLRESPNFQEKKKKKKNKNKNKVVQRGQLALMGVNIGSSQPMWLLNYPGVTLPQGKLFSNHYSHLECILKPIAGSTHRVADSVGLNGAPKFGFPRNSYFIPVFLIENHSSTIWLDCRVTKSIFFYLNKAMHQVLKIVGFYCYP